MAPLSRAILATSRAHSARDTAASRAILSTAFEVISITCADQSARDVSRADWSRDGALVTAGTSSTRPARRARFRRHVAWRSRSSARKPSKSASRLALACLRRSSAPHAREHIVCRVAARGSGVNVFRQHRHRRLAGAIDRDDRLPVPPRPRGLRDQTRSYADHTDVPVDQLRRSNVVIAALTGGSLLASRGGSFLASVQGPESAFTMGRNTQ